MQLHYRASDFGLILDCYLEAVSGSTLWAGIDKRAGRGTAHTSNGLDACGI